MKTITYREYMEMINKLNAYANEVLVKYSLDERIIEIMDNNFGMASKVNFGINWSAIGKVEPSKAMDFAKALQEISTVVEFKMKEYEGYEFEF